MTLPHLMDVCRGKLFNLSLSLTSHIDFDKDFLFFSRLCVIRENSFERNYERKKSFRVFDSISRRECLGKKTLKL